MSKTTNKARMQKTVRLVELALLTAIIAVMTFTPIGYLKLGPLELTLITVSYTHLTLPTTPYV